MNTFGYRLRESRKAKNITQKELADKIGAKHNSISNWENDQNKPDPDTIELICGVLEIEPNYLINNPIEKLNDWRTHNETHKTLMVNDVERKIVHNYRKADGIDQAIVLRTLHIDVNNEIGTINEQKQNSNKKYIPTEEDIKSLVARNGKKFTREEAIEFISALFSEDEDE